MAYLDEVLLLGLFCDQQAWMVRVGFWWGFGQAFCCQDQVLCGGKFGFVVEVEGVASFVLVVAGALTLHPQQPALLLPLQHPSQPSSTLHLNHSNRPPSSPNPHLYNQLLLILKLPRTFTLFILTP